MPRKKPPRRPGAPKRRKKPKRRFPAEPLTREEVRLLLGACGESASGWRNRTMILVMWRTGLRCAETLALRPKDVDRDRLLIRVLRGKGGHMRTVGIDADTVEALDAWLERRRELPLEPTSPLFPNRWGRELTTGYLRQLLPDLARKAGIEKRVHAHGLRHTHSLELAEEGMAINVIQQQLGHSNAATTSHYLQRIAPQQVLHAVRNRPSWKSEVQ